MESLREYPPGCTRCGFLLSATLPSYFASPYSPLPTTSTLNVVTSGTILQYMNIFLLDPEEYAPHVVNLLFSLLTCYDRLLGWYFFYSLLCLSSYVSLRSLPISGGPVCILTWSPALLSCALFSGHSHPCSPPTFPFLSGVGFHL